MRARAGTALGVVVVLAFAAACIWVTATTTSADRSTDRPARGVAAQRFIDAWERSRTATFLTTGTFERRSDVTGAEIRSKDVLAQRPPRRLHRQLGGVDGRHDDRMVICPAPPPGPEQQPPCHLGEPGGTTYEESVQREVAALRELLSGRDPLYDVSLDDAGCFRLDQRRPDPRVPFGVAARFCFDQATGAPVRTEVRYEGGVREIIVVHEVRTDVTEEHLEP